MVVSTPPGSDREAALEAGRGFAAVTFGDNHPYALVRHEDGEHPHVHIVVRMRGDDGRLFKIERGEFHALRERFAEQCRAHGISMNARPRQVRGAARSEVIALLKMRERGDTPEIDKRAAERNEAKRAQMTVQAGKLRRFADYLDAGGAETRPERARGERAREDDREAGVSRSGEGVAVQEREALEIEPQVTPPRCESEQVRKIWEVERRRREREGGQDREGIDPV